MDCPGGDGRLKAVHIASLRLHRCPDCGGTWYDKDQLSVLKDRESAGDYRWIDVDLWRERERFRAGRQEGLVCPNDRQRMTTVRYGTSRVRVDICARCEGIWLDQSEYEKILRYLEKRVNTETLREYLHDVRDEFIEIFTGRESIPSEIADFLKVLHLLELRFIVQHKNIGAALQAASRGVPGA